MLKILTWLWAAVIVAGFGFTLGVADVGGVNGLVASDTYSELHTCTRQLEEARK